ncbi:MAG: SusC/RagA family TonB-linked outer membrane protein [Bacteroidales bacterium]
MRLYKISQVFCYFLLLLLMSSITGTLSGQKKSVRESQTVSITLKITDESGAVLSNAKVVVGEGRVLTETGIDGLVTINAKTSDYVTVTLRGYEKNVSLVQDLLSNNTIQLVKSKLYMTTDDDIPFPFVTMKKRHVTGSYSTLTSDQLEKYPSTDLRNAFTGLVNGVEVLELNGSPGFSSEERLGLYRITDKINLISRGRNMRFIIDNMPLDITAIPLDPAELGSVTFIKDIVGKAMYGPYAGDGIICIRTKRGLQNERILGVNVESGVSVIDRMPGWVGGADYARLNNKARIASGLEAKYSPADITAYENGDPYDKYHPNINFREMLLKDTKSFRRVNLSSSGGSEGVQYAAYVGYNYEDDIFKLGHHSDYSRLIARSNFDIRLNEVLKVEFDIDATVTVRRSPNYGYTSTVGESGSQMDLQELSSALPHITDIPPVAFPVYARYDEAAKVKWYGVSNDYKFNPVGNMVDNGYYAETGRMGSTNFVLKYDLGNFVPGLKSKTDIGLNVNNVLRIGKALDYNAYIVTPSVSPSTGNDTILLTKVHDGVTTSALSNLHDYYTQQLIGFENLCYERAFGVHAIQTDLTYIITRKVTNGITEPQRMQNVVWSGHYIYNDNISVQAVLNYAGTYSFAKDKRYALFPSLGVSWVILSDDGDGLRVGSVDYLKLRGEVGIIGYESFMVPYLFRDNWSSGTGAAFGPVALNQWFGSTTGAPYITSKSRSGNPNLTWETRKEVNFGFDAILFDHKLSLEVNYYNQLRDGVITQLYNLPYLAGVSNVLPYFNYNKIRYYGVETGIWYTGNFNKGVYSVGGSFSVQNSKYKKFAEPSYRFDYQYRTGLPVDTYFGQTYLGKFQNDVEALQIPQLYDEVLHRGDLKYKDMNGDNVIDDNDMSPVGHTSPRLIYSLNAQLRYRQFTLTFTGTGRAFYDIPLTNKYFWNGWGDNNYSNFVRDNEGEAYPRLTYYKVNNNFVNSDFWLTKGDFFKVQNVELAYNLPVEKIKLINMGGFRVYIRGANLLTISGVKEVDPESINSGVTEYPLYKTFSGGIKLTF